MRIFAADNGYIIDHKYDEENPFPFKILVSFFGGWKTVIKHMKPKISLFLDSGAYSAWSKGIAININEYIAFIKQYEKSLDMYANLDVIGDPEATLENQKYMESKGLLPLPCYHFGEDEKYLKLYLSKYDYIAIGGMVSIPRSTLKDWLDNIWGRYLVNEDGQAKIKVHAYGMTSTGLVRRYPWRSVDSTSWVLTGRFGGVYCSIGDFTKVIVSEKGNLDGASHYIQLPKHDQENIKEYFENLGKGYKIEDLASDYKLRDEVNILYYLNLEKELTENPPIFKLSQFGLFTDQPVSKEPYIPPGEDPEIPIIEEEQITKDEEAIEDEKGQFLLF